MILPDLLAGYYDVIGHEAHVCPTVSGQKMKGNPSRHPCTKFWDPNMNRNKQPYFDDFEIDYLQLVSKKKILKVASYFIL